MSPVAEKIYQAIKELIRERDTTQSQIKKLDLEIDLTKKQLRKNESASLMHIASPSGNTPSDIQFTNDMREIIKLKRVIKSNEEQRQHNAIHLAQLRKQIEHYTFWMHYADTADESKQREAEKVIFG